jgi:ATP synthase in type III secretion protein N
VLVEGGDMDEPIADEVRGVLDGHVVLDRAIAARGRYPAIDVTVSLSRVMDQIVAREHAEAARKLRALLGAYEQKRDLIALGAYAKGADPIVDRALAKMPAIEALLSQDPADKARFDDTVAQLIALLR